MNRDIKQRYDAINGLKAYSTLGIILMHVSANGNYNIDGFIYQRLIPSFTNLVFLFMILSSFGMCCGYYDKIIHNEISIEEFYKRRYLRILPYFAFMCLIDVIISPKSGSIVELFANLTLCFGLLPNAGNISVIGVGWFLGLVFVFYLTFPFFVFLIGNKKRAWISFIVAYIFNILCERYFDVGRTNIVYCAVFFIGGGVIYLYRDSLLKLAVKFKFQIATVDLLFVASYYILARGSILIMLLMFSLLLICTLGIHQEGILQNSFTRFLGNINMEIYLSHMAIYRLIEKMDATCLFSSDILSYIVTVIGTIIGVVLFVEVTQRILLKCGSVIKHFKENIECHRM